MTNQSYDNYMHIFLEMNSKLNLISKNDEKFLWEKHVFDSLAIEKFFNKYGFADMSGKTLLDIGTGGGFPALPAAIAYPELSVTALDSIRKKINAVSAIAGALNLKNLEVVCSRAENYTDSKFDFVTSRAVSALKNLIPLAIPHLKPGGYFVAYKSVKVNDEISEAKPVLSKFNVKICDIIEYDLPLEENHTRNLVVMQKL